MLNNGLCSLRPNVGLDRTRARRASRSVVKLYSPGMVLGSSTNNPQTCIRWAGVSKYKKLASSPLSLSTTPRVEHVLIIG